MLSASDDNSFSCQGLSRLYCSMIFGHYGVFATLPLQIVLAEADIDIETAFSTNMPLNIASFGYSDYFTFNELAFLSTIFSDARPLSAEHIERDKCRVSREVTEYGEMCKLHAEYLLKAITFWEMYYEEKYEEWTQRLLELHKARMARINLATGYFSDDGVGDDDDDGLD
jgi:hypothetical protein